MRAPRTGTALSSTLLAAVLLATSAGPASAHKRKKHSDAPVLEALTYTPTTSHGSNGYLEADITATIRLYKPAPSITFTIDSTTNHNVETEAGPEASYGPGVHKVSFTTDAFSGGTYRFTLYALVRPPKNSDSLRPPAPLKSSDPATVVIAEAPEGVAGAGVVSKL
jgi:hypothetical protein